ncbi:MAG: right-handed parallel beta-helix repeat-containing protein, partial [Anaerohalosphaera sp.]|nr:right-handed parallel beta-helix repeat-containing protein [Anaerohalosphaera sp.]
MTKLIYLSAILAVTAAATAADLNVPAHYTTIQEAIDIAVDGDTVIIADGTHTGPGNYNCLILGKNITIKSQNGPANCIIDCQGTSEDRRRAFGTTSEVTIDGFTITNSFGGSSKAISTGQGANLSIKNCILTSQQRYVYDDAPFINISNSSATIENCRIDGNSTGANGINVSYSTLTINNSIITKCDYGIYSGGSDSSLWAVSCHI